jgi:hypothetical protein
MQVPHTNLMGDFNAKVDKEDIFKPTIGSNNLHKNNNAHSVSVVNAVKSKN